MKAWIFGNEIWQCGGSLEVIPCSNVAHLYRISTYSFGGIIKMRNNVRLVEVWMEEFNEYYYLKSPSSRQVDPGDLKKIYPESEMLIGYKYMGQIKNVGSQQCLDQMNKQYNEPACIYPCHGMGGNQGFSYQNNDMIMSNPSTCLAVEKTEPIHSMMQVLFAICDNNNLFHKWMHDKTENFIISRATNSCLTAINTELYVDTCNRSIDEQKWILERSSWTNSYRQARGFN